MRICENGIYRDMTEAEAAAVQAAAARAAAAERHRPLTVGEVQKMLIRAQINTLAVDDATAVRMTAFYPEWASGISYTVGYKVQYNGKLYKILQAHTSIVGWEPDITASLFTVIDEVHDGTKYDPIPYEGNMVLENGKYYTQDNVTYLCNRDTGNPVYQALSALVGLYVEII